MNLLLYIAIALLVWLSYFIIRVYTTKKQRIRFLLLILIAITPFALSNAIKNILRNE
jgi:hypothetical protein